MKQALSAVLCLILLTAGALAEENSNIVLLFRIGGGQYGRHWTIGEIIPNSGFIYRLVK